MQAGKTRHEQLIRSSKKQSQKSTKTRKVAAGFELPWHGFEPTLYFVKGFEPTLSGVQTSMYFLQGVRTWSVGVRTHYVFCTGGSNLPARYFEMAQICPLRFEFKIPSAEAFP